MILTTTTMKKHLQENKTNVSCSCQCNDNNGNNSCRFNAKNPLKLSNNHAKLSTKTSAAFYNAYNKCQKFNLSLIIVICCLLQTVTKIQGAAIYSNVGFRSNSTFEPICHHQQEHFIESEGKESSLILEFNPAVSTTQHRSCTRILSSPPNYGFIVRLILPKNRHSHYHSSTKIANKENKASGVADSISDSSNGNKMPSFMDKFNASTAGLKSGRSCSLSVFSFHNPHTPEWRVDPCQLEDTAPEMEDPVRLFHGRIRIVWEHHNHTLNSKLMVTVLGKGAECHSEKKHQCLRIGDYPILCISKDLVCDGIRHCPNSNEYDSDEDYAMCWKRSRLGGPIPPARESDVLEHFALEVFHNLFAFDVPNIMKATSRPLLESDDDFTEKPSGNKTMLHKVSKDTKTVNDMLDNGMENLNSTLTIENTANATEALGNSNNRRNSTRGKTEFSNFGPWGYLMLGILSCGGVVLICAIWASASEHAANNERESALESANAAALGQDNHSITTAPPNYEDLDPPPAYSVLFPNQKASSSNTLNSLDATSVQPSLAQLQHLQLSPSAAASSRSTLRMTSDRASGSNQATTAPPSPPPPPPTHSINNN